MDFMLGIGCNSKTYKNLIEQKECVVNFPQAALFHQVEGIANLTGLYPVPDNKKENFKYGSDKFTSGGFTPIGSELVKPPRIAECKLQFEAVLKNVLHVNGGSEENPGVAAIEVKVLKVHVDEDLIIGDQHIDPAKWNPMIYNFRHYYGLGDELGKSFRAEV